MSRRSPIRRAIVAPVALLAVFAAACGGDDGSTATTDAATTSPAAAATSAPSTDVAFPVTVEHYFGSTTIEAAPSRVLALGDFAELDNLLALGVTPVAFGYTDSWATGTPPWQTDAGSADLERFDASGDISPETVATYDPDLIIAMPSPAEEHLDALQAIAPVIGISWSADWREALHVVAQATGTTALATTLEAEVDAATSAAAAELTEYADLNVMVGSFYGDVLYVQGAESPVTVLLERLGLTVQPGPEPVLTEYSLEEIPQLTDAELLLALATDPAGTAEAESNPLWQALPAVGAGRYTAVEPTLARGLADGFNALSYGWVLPRIVDVITETASGDGTPLT